MKLLKSLPARLLLGIVIGIIAGLIVPEFVMLIIVTVKYILGQLIAFSVPLIIIGFIAPSITKPGANATRLLSVALASAYVSSLGAAVLSMIAGYLIIPHLNHESQFSAPLYPYSGRGTVLLSARIVHLNQKKPQKQRKTLTFSLCAMRGYVSMFIGITYALFMCVNA